MEWHWAEREREREGARGIYINQEFIARQCYISLIYEVGAETEVIVNASPVGLDAMLTQKKRDGDRHITYLVLLNRVTVRRNEKHWLFTGRASVYVCTWLEHGSRS